MYSRQEHLSDGTLTSLDLAIGYIKRGDISVLLDGVATNDWEWVPGNNSIQFPAPVPSGMRVTITRTTQRDKVINIFDKGASFTNRSMDTDFQQMLYLAQEYSEGAGVTDLYNDLDMHGFRVRNLGDGSLPMDAVNLRQLEAKTVGVQEAAESARAAAALAHDATITANDAAYRADSLRADLSKPIGASMIGVFTGTDPARDVQQQLDMLYFGIANITDTKFAGGARPDGSDSTAAIQAALDSSNYVYIPPGTFVITSLSMSKNNAMLTGSGYNQSVLQMAETPTVGIRAGADASISGLVLQDFKLQGNATNLGGIQLGSLTHYCAIPMLDRVGVWGFSRATVSNGFGVQLVQVQNATIRNCWLYRNRHQIQRPTGGYCTSTRIEGKSGYIGEGFIGIYIEGQCDDITVADVILEGNSNSAIMVTSSAVTVGRGTTLYVSGTYFEVNNSTGLGVIYMVGGSGAYQNHVLVMDKVNFASNSGYFVNLDRTVSTIGRCKLIPQQVLLTDNCTAHFEHNWFPNAGDYLVGYRALKGNVTVHDFTPESTSTDLNQVNLLNSVTFPKIPRLVKDQYTLDDYREFVEGQWVPTPTGISGTISELRGQYVKIGRQFNVQLVMSVTGLTNTFGNGGVYLPFQPTDNTSGSMFIVSSGKASGVYVDAATGAVLLPDLPLGDYILMINVTCFARE